MCVTIPSRLQDEYYVREVVESLLRRNYPKALTIREIRDYVCGESDLNYYLKIDISDKDFIRILDLFIDLRLVSKGLPRRVKTKDYTRIETYRLRK